jgi:hypothetical protein
VSDIPWDYSEFGSSHRPTVRLSKGTSKRCALYVGKKEDHLLLLFPLDGMDEGIMYLVSQ